MIALYFFDLMNLLRHFQSRTSCKKQRTCFKRSEGQEKWTKKPKLHTSWPGSVFYATIYLVRQVWLWQYTPLAKQRYKGPTVIEPRRSFGEAIDVATWFLQELSIYNWRRWLLYVGNHERNIRILGWNQDFHALFLVIGRLCKLLISRVEKRWMHLV